MIALPSTTHVNRRLPKEAFYKHLKLDTKQRDEFVHGIEQIRIANSIKPTTMRIANGEKVHEILVVEMALRQELLPEGAISATARTNPHKLLFRCTYNKAEAFALFRDGTLWATGWKDGEAFAIEPRGATLDELWDSICGGVIFGNCAITDIDARINRERVIQALDREIEKLERKHRKEKQPHLRNELYRQLKEACAKRDALREG